MTERQLHLFRGKKQRGDRIPHAKEYELHCMVADVLRRWCSPAWRYTHMPMGERRDPATAMRLKRMGVTPGWADFLLVGPRKTIVWLELKRPGGTAAASDGQDELAQFLRACGHRHIVTNDFQMALDLLRDLGIVTVSAHWRGDPALGIKRARYSVRPG